MLVKNRMFLVFAAIGIVNTSVDIGLFLLLQGYGLPIIIANIVSTSIALSLSFILNKRFTFNSSANTGRAVLPFLIVTLTGLWLLQPVIIYAVISVSNLAVIKDVLSPIISNYSTWQNLTGKLIATPASMIWNFLLYKRFVFK